MHGNFDLYIFGRQNDNIHCNHILPHIIWNQVGEDYNLFARFRFEQISTISQSFFFIFIFFCTHSILWYTHIIDIIFHFVWHIELHLLQWLPTILATVFENDFVKLLWCLVVDWAFCCWMKIITIHNSTIIHLSLIIFLLLQWIRIIKMRFLSLPLHTSTKCNYVNNKGDFSSNSIAWPPAHIDNSAKIENTFGMGIQYFTTWDKNMKNCSIFLPYVIVLFIFYTV